MNNFNGYPLIIDKIQFFIIIEKYYTHKRKQMLHNTKKKKVNNFVVCIRYWREGVQGFYP